MEIAMELLESLRSKNLDDALQLVLEHMGCEIGTLHVIEADGKLHLRAHSKAVPSDLLEASRIIPIGKGIAGLAAQNKHAMSMADLFVDSQPRLPDLLDAEPAGAICVPMFKGADVVGTLGVATQHARTFTRDEEELLTKAAGVIADRL
jgi:L-methionine (R)-S-oxide reductase